MGARTVRTDIPLTVDPMLNLGTNVRTKHTAMGINSPLYGSMVDMAIFDIVHQLAKDKRTEAIDKHAFGEAAIQAADNALGIAKGQNIETTGTVYYSTGRIRKQLLLAYQGVEEEASTFGFKVVISERKGNTTVRVGIPLKKRKEMETLGAKIVARHTTLGVNSPLNNAEVAALAA